MRGLLLVSMIAALALTVDAHAQQDTVALVVGERVRVHQGGRHDLVGTLAAADSLRITVITSPLDTIPVARAAVTGIDRWAGTQSKTGEGALVGLGIGVAGGVIVGAIACGGNDYSMSTGGCIAAAAGIFGLVGAAAGAIIWHGWTTDRWEPAVWPTVTIQPSGSSASGMALGVRLRI